MTKTNIFIILLTAFVSCAGTNYVTTRMVKAETLVGMQQDKKDLMQLGFIDQPDQIAFVQGE